MDDLQPRIRTIVLRIVSEFIFKLLTPNTLATGAVPERVSGLDHGFMNYTVESDCEGKSSGVAVSLDL